MRDNDRELDVLSVGPAALAMVGAAPSCDARPGPVVAENRDVRVVVSPGSESELTACRRGHDETHVIPGYTVDGEPVYTGSIDVRLTGPILTYRMVGVGCGEGPCEGPVSIVVDMRNPRRGRAYTGAFGVAVAPDGRTALLERVRHTDDPGREPGPGPFRVAVVVHDKRTVLDRRAGIDPYSLRVKDARIRWTVGGVRVTRRFPR